MMLNTENAYDEGEVFDTTSEVIDKSFRSDKKLKIDAYLLWKSIYSNQQSACR